MNQKFAGTRKLRAGKGMEMSGTEIIQEYEDRLRRSGIFRGFTVLLFILSIIGLAAYSAFREEYGIWGEILLPAGIILLVLAFGIAIVSIITLRCPNCFGILGGIRAVAYCPSCGTKLKEIESRALDYSPGGELAEGAEEFSEETYPKDIRLFTKPDETELTKRFIHLIQKDEDAQSGDPDEPDSESEGSDEDPESYETDVDTDGYRKAQFRIDYERNKRRESWSILQRIIRFVIR